MFWRRKHEEKTHVLETPPHSAFSPSRRADDVGSTAEIYANRVPKWWRHKNEICKIMGLVKIFWKNNVQDAYSPKIRNSGQFSRFHKNPSKFGLVHKIRNRVTFRRICIESSEHNWANISEIIYPKLLIFGE